MKTRIASLILSSTVGFCPLVFAQQAPPDPNPAEPAPEPGAAEPALPGPVPAPEPAAPPVERAPAPAASPPRAERPPGAAATTAPPSDSPQAAAPPGAEPFATQPSAPGQRAAAGPPRDEVARPSAPVDQRFNLAFNIDLIWNTDESFDLFSEDDVPVRPGLSAGYAVWMSDRLSVVPELGWGVEGVDSKRLFDGALNETELDAHTFYGGASLRFELLEFLEPHVRLAGGLSLVDIKVRSDLDSGAFEDDGTSPFGSAGAGIALKTPDRTLETPSGAFARLQAVLLVEGGFILAAPLDLTVTRETQDQRIEVAWAELGELARSGPYLRTAFALRF